MYSDLKRFPTLLENNCDWVSFSMKLHYKNWPSRLNTSCFTTDEVMNWIKETIFFLEKIMRCTAGVPQGSFSRLFQVLGCFVVKRKNISLWSVVNFGKHYLKIGYQLSSQYFNLRHSMITMCLETSFEAHLNITHDETSTFQEQS